MQLGSGVAVAVAVALIRHLAGEPPYAMGAALEKKKRPKKKKQKTITTKKNRTPLSSMPFRTSLPSAKFKLFEKRNYV